MHYGYFVQFADCKPIENLLFYKYRKKGEVYGSLDLADVDGKKQTVVLDADGKRSALTVDELKKQLIAKYPRLVKGNPAGGAGGMPQPAGGAGGKNITEQHMAYAAQHRK